MEDYGRETDPANLDFDHLGNVDHDDDQRYGRMTHPSGTKIDYSREPPVPFQKTATLVNYFITNTAQFLNT